MRQKTTLAPEGQRNKPWIFRTYSGHSSAAASNALYRTNLARGQTGLSVAFDLPTQTGYDSDHQLARGEVGKVGVPIGHLGDMRKLFDSIPLAHMNTSMTINATAPWLLALYIALADERGTPRAALQGTVQNDLLKEYLSRGTYIFPPQSSMRLVGDVIGFTAREVPQWNPINVCSYHLQEAGATPVQELAFALAIAIAVLDQVRDAGEIDAAEFPRVVGRVSFFVNAGIRFITEICKMRAFVRLWDEICRERYGVGDEKYRRFRYGVQVNSLGLTEQQPENNVYRILLEMLAVVLSKDARARAVQLPAWNEALGLPRPFDQQWSLRLQQIVAYETDLLEYDDIFNGSPVIEAKVEELMDEARVELERIIAMGGTVATVESGYLKSALVESNTRRTRAIESGEMPVIGVNCFSETAPSPLLAGGDGGFLAVGVEAEHEAIRNLDAWRAVRDNQAVRAALAALREAAVEGRNIMPPSIEAAKAGATTGEWAATLRQVFGEYRAPTGLLPLPLSNEDEGVTALRERVWALTDRLGRTPKILVAKPGLDGHSNGAEQIAMKARDCGLAVVYPGIRMTTDEIVALAVDEAVQAVGLSILSGSHITLAMEILAKLNAAHLGALPVLVGGIVPPEDEMRLRAAGVAAIYTPKHYRLTDIMGEMIEFIARHIEANPPAACAPPRPKR